MTKSGLKVQIIDSMLNKLASLPRNTEVQRKKGAISP
jgi:hypothetical protein